MTLVRLAPLLAALAGACVPTAPTTRQAPDDARPPLATASASPAAPGSTADAGQVDAAPVDAAAPSDAQDRDPMANHQDTREELLQLFSLRPMTAAETARIQPDVFLAHNFGPAVTRMNQGNKAIAQHSISKEACLRGLEGVVLQTDAQKAVCGAPNMVPIYRHGDPASAHYCIDVFEFPDRPCELPIVWAAPTHAEKVCELEGKRLCSQEEWQLACRADPAGGADRLYAYGDDLDLDICDTHKPRGPESKCTVTTAEKAWQTCGTNTEPAGAFPACKSRFGVYDQHGNVAEIMTRVDREKGMVSQLKGSAFFYSEVARRPKDPPRADGRETYPDTCNYDPRWHVEHMDSAWHVNYHLGFRCCKSVTVTASSATP
jgi:sulfatase modifying factor 1